MIQTRKELHYYLNEDFKRNSFSYNAAGRIKRFMLDYFGAENACALGYLVLLRKCEYYYNNRFNPLSKTLYILYKLRLSRAGRKLNIRIPLNTVGYGLRIHHIAGGGGCLLNCQRMGNYCGVNSGVLLGNNKDRFDIPIIGDNVMLNAGCKVFGKITIGNNANIGAGAVVTKDVPDGGVAVGCPARIIRIQTCD